MYVIVLRQSDGHFIMGLMGFLEAAHCARLAEALGLWEALSWLKNNDATNVDIKIDAILSRTKN